MGFGDLVSGIVNNGPAGLVTQMTGGGQLSDQLGLTNQPYQGPGMGPQLRTDTNTLQSNAETNTPDSYAKQTMSGVPGGSNTLNTTADQNNQQTQSLGGQSDMGLSGAIQNKSNKMYNQSLAAIGSQAQFQGAIENVSRSNDAANMQVNLANAQRGINTQVGQYQVAQSAARYGIVNSLFKGAGSFSAMPKNQQNPLNGGTPDMGNSTPFSSGNMFGPQPSGMGMNATDNEGGAQEFGNAGYTDLPSLDNIS